MRWTLRSLTERVVGLEIADLTLDDDEDGEGADSKVKKQDDFLLAEYSSISQAWSARYKRRQRFSTVSRYDPREKRPCPSDCNAPTAK